MSSDLVDRVRELADDPVQHGWQTSVRLLLPELADRVEELEATIERTNTVKNEWMQTAQIMSKDYQTAEALNARLTAALRTALNVIDTTHAQAFGRDVLVPPHHGDPTTKGEIGGGYCWACEFTLQAPAM